MAYDQCIHSSAIARSAGRTKAPPDTYTGKISNYSRKRLKRAIELIVAIARDKDAKAFRTGKTYKFKLNFITFTLPAAQGTNTDKTIKKSLDLWIKRAKRKHGLRSYVWRAEVQGNGNIHFHMITDTFIRWDHIRNDWNSCLNKSGLIDAFAAKHGHRNPNSTDVHAIKKIKNLSAYFVKYMSKDHKDGERKLEGKVWDCSKNLKTKENVNYEIGAQELEVFDQVCRIQDVRKVQTDRYTIAFIRHTDFHKILPGTMVSDWLAYLGRIRAA